MSKVPRRTISEAVASHMYFTDVHKTEEYVRNRKEYVRSVASYLMETGRTRELDSILRDISADWARIGYVEAIVRTAHPLDASARETIAARVKSLYPESKKILMTEVLDPNVIGGVQINLPNRQLDLSVEAKLNKFKQLTTVGKDK